jgi:hypothetical protein
MEFAIAIAAVVVLVITLTMFAKGRGRASDHARQGEQSASWPKVSASITDESIRTYEDEAGGFYQVYIRFSFLEPIRDHYKSRDTLAITVHLPVAPGMALLDVKKAALARAVGMFKELQPQPRIEDAGNGAYHRVRFRCNKKTGISTADGQHPEDGIELNVEVARSFGGNHASLTKAANLRAMVLFKEAGSELSR